MITTSNMTTEYRGLSTDSKPTEARNGDLYIEIDTGSLYIYDEENDEWDEVTSGGSSPPSGGLEWVTTFEQQGTFEESDDNMECTITLSEPPEEPPFYNNSPVKISIDSLSSYGTGIVLAQNNAQMYSVEAPIYIDGDMGAFMFTYYDGEGAVRATALYTPSTILEGTEHTVKIEVLSDRG